MKTLTLVLVSAIALSAGIARADYGNCYTTSDGYAIQTYHQYENSVLQWNRAYTAAPGGSWDEQNDLRQMQNAGQTAINALSQPNALAGYSPTDLESFANESNQKYNASPGGSYVEGFYRQALAIAWEAYQNNETALLNNCGNPGDWQSVVNAAQQITQKYNAAPGGSLAESTYRNVMQTAWSAAQQKVTNSINANPYDDFRNFENLGLGFTNSYNTAPGGSLAESFYRQAAQTEFNAGVTSLQYQVTSISTTELYAIQNEYQQKENAAPGGSAYEAFTRNVLQIVQNEISNRLNNPVPPPYPQPQPPNPYPQPQPNPYPPNPYPPHPPHPPGPPPGPTPGPWSCLLTVQGGRHFPGTGASEGQANAKAHDNCLKGGETSFVCNAGSVVCHEL